MSINLYSTHSNKIFNKYEIFISNITTLNYNDVKKYINIDNFIYCKKIIKNILFNNSVIYINEEDKIFSEIITYDNKYYKYNFNDINFIIQNKQTFLKKINYIPFNKDQVFNFKIQHILKCKEYPNILFIFEENNIYNNNQTYYKFFIEIINEQFVNKTDFEDYFFIIKDMIISFINNIN